jgi:hypothetical protein
MIKHKIIKINIINLYLFIEAQGCGFVIVAKEYRTR